MLIENNRNTSENGKYNHTEALLELCVVVGKLPIPRLQNESRKRYLAIEKSRDAKLETNCNYIWNNTSPDGLHCSYNVESFTIYDEPDELDGAAETNPEAIDDGCN